MIDTSFLTGGPVTPLLNPLDIQAQKIRIRNALAAGALQDQQIQSGALGLEQQRRDVAADAAFRALYTQPAAAAPGAAPAPAMAPAAGLPVGPDGSPLPTAPAFAPPAPGGAPAVATSPAGPGAAAPTAAHDIPDDQILGLFGQRGYALIHSRNEASKMAADRAKTLSDVAAADTNYWGSLAYGLKSVDFDPRAVQAAASKAAADGYQNTPAFRQFLMAAQQGPAALSGLADQAIAASPDQQKLLNERTTAAAKQTDATNNTTRTDAEVFDKNKADLVGALGGAQNQADWSAIIAGANPKVIAALNVPPAFSPQNQASVLAKGQNANEQITSAETARRDAATAANEKRARDQEQQNINLRAQVYHQQYGNPLENATPAELSTAKMRAAGTAPLPSPRTKGYDRAIALAAAVDPTFAQYAGTRFQTISDFRTKGDANNLVAITTALSHLDRAQLNSKALGLEPTLGLNWSPTQRRFHQDIYNLTDEVGRLIKSGVIPEGETNRMLSNLSSVSQSNRDAGIDELKVLMGGKFEGITQKFRNGTGFALPITMFDEKTRGLLVKNGLAQGLDMGAAAPGAPGAPAAPAAAPGAAPGAAAPAPPADLGHKSTAELFDMLKGSH